MLRRSNLDSAYINIAYLPSFLFNPEDQAHKMFQLKAKMLYNKRVSNRYFHLAVRAPRIAVCAKPGQFVNIRVTDAIEPLLRRPLSIHRITGANTEVLYEALGPATEILSRKKAGEYLDIIGPLGDGFNYKLPSCRFTASPVLVAGGMGVAPLIFLAEKLAEIKNQKSILRLRSGLMVSEAEPPKIKTLILIGAKTKKQILCEKEFKKLGCRVKIATDDGSAGFEGKVTELLNHELRTMNHELRTIYACGPKPMLKEISRISQNYKIPAQVSLEEHMACGIGACLGCAVNTKEGFKRVCKDGPVFDAREIVW